MNGQKVSFAIRLPESLLDNIDQEIQENDTEVSIERKIPELKTGPADVELGFDPITGTAIAWVAFKFIGEGAAAVALGLLTNVIYDWLKERRQKEEDYQIAMRFPNGKEVSIHSNHPLSLEELESIIQKNGRV